MAISYNWDDLIDRLSKQRVRIGATKDDMKRYILARYGIHFSQLAGHQVIDLGSSMAKVNSIDELFTNLNKKMNKE